MPYPRRVGSPPVSSTPIVTAVLAHQGGWDEILLVAGPIAVVIGLLALVKRRVEEAARRAAAKDVEPAPPTDH